MFGVLVVGEITLLSSSFEQEKIKKARIENANKYFNFDIYFMLFDDYWGVPL
mgnify:CR=1 FL=1